MVDHLHLPDVRMETINAAAASVKRLSDSLTEVERLLKDFRSSERGQRIEELSRIGTECVAYASYEAPQNSLSWSFTRPFLMIGFLLRALVLPPESPEMAWFGNTPTWVYDKMRDLYRAELLTTGGGALPWQPPFHLTSSWLEAMPRRWPRANALPRYILRTLGCPASNSSVRQLISGAQQAQFGRHCRPQLASFSPLGFRQLSSQLVARGRDQLDFFTWLRPIMDVRPLLPGQALDLELLKIVLERHIHDSSGLFLEFGVYKGRSLSVIARHLQSLGGGHVYGFDSLRGLPSAFLGGAGLSDKSELGEDLPAGHFQADLEEVEMEDNAELVIGYFNETLPGFLEGRLPNGNAPAPEPLRLVHLDCDLASSTLEVLMALAPLITPGCVVVLDDFVNFYGFREATFKGFEEFIRSGLGPQRYEVLAAPWSVLVDADIPNDYRGWRPEDRFDLERAVAFRAL